MSDDIKRLNEISTRFRATLTDLQWIEKRLDESLKKMQELIATHKGYDGSAIAYFATKFAPTKTEEKMK